MKLLLLKFWKEIVGILAIILIIVSVYSYGYTKGAYEVKEAYLEESIKRQKEIDGKIAEVAKDVTAIISLNTSKNANTKKDLELILKEISKGPYVVIKDNKCVLDPSWSEHYNRIIKEVNK